MNKLTLALALALPCLAFAQAPASPPKAAAKGPVATVNGVVIPRQRADAVLRMQSGRGAQDDDLGGGPGRDLLINNALLGQEGTRSGIAKRPEVLEQIDLGRQETIANAVINEYVKSHPVNDGEIQKEYDTAKARTGDREYKAR